MRDTPQDCYSLSRFVEAQADDYNTALRELRDGAKRGHWIWYIFPQVAGLGFSSMAQQYAIRSRGEARAYLVHEILGERLVECAEALLSVRGRSAEQIMGYPDVLKLRSSMTLFSEVSPPGSIFRRVLEMYYGGEKDPKTVEYIAQDEIESA